jgi:hypothetical protein
MKKLLYIIALIAVASYVLSSCTEEVVKPRADKQIGGSGVVE